MRAPPILAAVLISGVACSNLISVRSDIDAERVQNVKRELKIGRVNFSPGEVRVRKIADHPNYTVYYLVTRSLVPSGISKNDFIPGDFTKQRHGSKKLAVLLSGMGETGSTMRIGNRLASAGYDVLRLYPKIQIFDLGELDTKDHWTKKEFRDFVRLGRTTLATRYGDVRHIVSHFKEAYRYKSIGIMGVSLGGITAYYLSGSNPDLFQSTIGIVTGGNLCEILLVSGEPKIAKIRDKIFAKFDIKMDEAREILCDELNDIDPLSVASRVPRKQALLVSNVLDSVIPHRYTKELWRKAHRPKWKFIMPMKFPVFWAVNKSFWLDGHYSSGLALLVPVPLFEFWGPVPFPVCPKTASSIVLDHFERTLK